MNPRYSLLFFLDWAAAPMAATCACIRIGNFFNSEIVGKPTKLPWAVTFLRIDHLPRHPSQLYESLAYAFICIVLTKMVLKTKAMEYRGRMIGWFFISMLTFRFMVEFLKENQSDFEANMSLNMGQWLSIPFVFLGIVLVWKSKSTRT